jgi:hypothetical protein
MIMQNNGPMAPPYLSTMSTSTTFPNMHSADAASFHIPNMRRVLSSPTKDHNRPRGPSDPYTGSRLPSNDHAHDYTDEYLPSFLRDRQSTNTKQAIKQMAEHRVLLDTNKPSTPLELSEEDDDEYAWYLQNPHRYVRRPRDRGGARKQRRKMVLYGEMVDERDDQTNRKLFAGYLVRHYGAALFRDEDSEPPASPYRRSAQHASTTPFSRATAESQAYWNEVDASDGDGSTVFWVDEWDVSSSPTLGDASSRHPKLSCVSSIDNPDSLLSGSFDFPATKTMPCTTHDAQDSKKRWFSDPRHPGEGKRNSFFRTNSTRMRSGSHRRFSFLRIFST